MTPQEARLLAAYEAAPNKQLTTVQRHNIAYMTNVRARQSGLEKLGYAFSRERIKGKHQSVYTYLGYTPIAASLVETKQYQPIGGWRPIQNGFMVMTLNGAL